MAVTSLDEAAALLYGHPSESFVAERDVLVKALRAEKNRDLANEVKALRKPSAVAAEVNRVVRADPAGVELILQAAGLLRAAQAGELDDGVNVGELQQQYRAAIQALAQIAVTKRAEVQAALAAATIDLDSNEALRTGSLVVVPEPVAAFGAGQIASLPTDELAARRAKREAKATPSKPESAQPKSAQTKSAHTVTTAAKVAEQQEAAERAAAEQAAAEQEAAAAEVAKQQAAEQEAAAAEVAKQQAAERAAAEQEAAKRAAKQAKKEHAARRKALRKDHRDALRAQLAALDEHHAATTAVETHAETVRDRTADIEELEMQLTDLREALAHAVNAHDQAIQAQTAAASHADEAESAVQALTAALHALDSESSEDSA